MAPFAKHAREVTAPTLTSMFDGLILDAPRVWLVMMEYDPRKPVLLEHLQQRFSRVERQRHGHIDLYLADIPRASLAPGPAAATAGGDQR